MGLFDKLLGWTKAPGATPATLESPQPQKPPAAAPDTAARKGILRKFESGLRRAVDGYVDKKADALMDDATRRAEEFRQETLELVQAHAMELLDITEQRIDRKLQDIESVLEERLRAEMRMRLRALIWTLAFVLLMALVSVGYVWFKQRAGLENSPANTASMAR